MSAALSIITFINHIYLLMCRPIGLCIFSFSLAFIDLTHKSFPILLFQSLAENHPESLASLLRPTTNKMLIHLCWYRHYQ
mmetsp:Transcript_6272/g.13456  ORF Transcript_6272/g.13456 Transcript_6272/m.13456 type:complete len:80 (-) Transcript_6272:876-1115(-)